MTHTKIEWRRVLLRARQTLRAPLRRTHSAAIVERLASLSEFAASRAVAVYLPVGAEVDPLALAALATSTGKAVYRPEGHSSGPAWVRHVLPSGADLVSALPAADLTTIAENPLLVVVPGVGFDISGTRLGRGRGFYDRALARLRQGVRVFVVGVAFEVQVVARLPQDPWDQPVDLVATERRVIVPDRQDDRHRSQRHTQEARDS